MTIMQFVKPAPGRRVRCPDTHVLAEAGELVAWDTYWIRRERDGDILVTETIESPAKAAPTKPAKEA